MGRLISFLFLMAGALFGMSEVERIVKERDLEAAKGLFSAKLEPVKVDRVLKGDYFHFLDYAYDLGELLGSTKGAKVYRLTPHGAILKSYDLHKKWVNSVWANEKIHAFATASDDGTATLYDYRNERLIKRFEPKMRDAMVQQATIREDGKELAFGVIAERREDEKLNYFDDVALYRYDIGTDRLQRIDLDAYRYISSLRYGGDAIYCITGRGLVKVENGEVKLLVEVPYEKNGWGLEVGERFIAFADNSGTLYLLDRSSEKVIRKRSIDGVRIKDIDFLTPDTMVVTAFGKVMIVNGDGEVVMESSGPRGGKYMSAVVIDGGRFVVSDSVGNLYHFRYLGSGKRDLLEYIRREGIYKYPRNSIDILFAVGRSREAVELGKELLKQRLKRHGLKYRFAFKYGPVGKRYVPRTTTSYTTYDRQTIIVDGQLRTISTPKEESYSSGGYDEKVMGYTAINQFKNGTSSYYLVQVYAKWHGRYSEYVTKEYGAWSDKQGSYRELQNKTLESSYEDAFILPPKSKVKFQFVVGEEKPDDLVLVIEKIKKVTPRFKREFEAALNAKRPSVELIRKFLNDPYLQKWHPRLRERLKEALLLRYRDKIRAYFLYDKEEYDPDFENDVVLVIKAPRRLKVRFRTPFGLSKEVVVDGVYKEKLRLQDVPRKDLRVEIVEVDE